MAENELTPGRGSDEALWRRALSESFKGRATPDAAKRRMEENMRILMDRVSKGKKGLLAELLAMSLVRITDIMAFGMDGRGQGWAELKDARELGDLAAAVQEVRVDRRRGKLEVKLVDRLAAMRLAAQIAGMIGSDASLEASNEKELTEADLRRIASGEMRPPAWMIEAQAEVEVPDGQGSDEDAR